jgi:hypothetical protein
MTNETFEIVAATGSRVTHRSTGKTPEKWFRFMTDCGIGPLPLAHEGVDIVTCAKCNARTGR